MLFVNNNGIVMSGDTPSILPNNRAYLYGDGVFETIRIRNGRPINVENHIKRLMDGARALKLRPASYFTPEFFELRIIELCEKSAITKGGKCHVSLDRIAGGTYFPETNVAQFFIDVEPFEYNNFQLNGKGLEVDVYAEMKKAKTIFSNFKTKNGLVYIMAALNARERNLDDVLITNEKNTIIESSNSNLFVVSNGVLYTPSLEEGCLAGTMRMQVINLALQNKIKVYECSILPQNLLAADEIFLTNAINGIVWISGYRTKRYFNYTAKSMIQYLNDYWDLELAEQPK
jgi:branched-subunit amino acid aminotransferase/4-amino-4-deoxychorismate lyase